MLAGLAGIALPLIAHLLSRKKYDQVDWGAMQFLELDPSAKRKVRLEELLLMLLRMGLISLVAIALARPWIGSEWLGMFVSTQPRDVVFIFDGSYSMEWDEQGNGTTSRTRSIQLARDFLGDLRPGDAIQIIDAREQPHFVLPELTRDAYRIQEAIKELPSPSGTADLASAIRKGIQVLASGTNLQREIIVFTDLQALSWKADDETLWAQLDDLRSQTPIAPRIWVVDASAGELGHSPNFALERLQISRETGIAGAPVRITSKVKAFGGDELSARKVFLEIDQLRLDDQTVHLKIPRSGETTVDFEHRFETVGSHLISLVLEDDALTGDNRADAVVTISESIPVLLVDGDRQSDPTKSETFFANAAFLAGGTEKPWISPLVITPEEITVEKLKAVKIAVIANARELTPEAIDGLKPFVASGHGLLFTLGNKIDKEFYRTTLYANGRGLLPVAPDSIVEEGADQKRGVRIVTNSLEAAWLQPFRADRGGTLSDARWSQWWKVSLSQQKLENGDPAPTVDSRRNDQHAAADVLDGLPHAGSPVVEATLTSGDPLLITRRFGNGVVAVLTSSLDADWNTLPAKQDYVPFLHEQMFSLATPTASRNVDIGAPLILPVSRDLKLDEYEFRDPDNKSLPAESVKGQFQPTVRLKNARRHGVYRFTKKLPKPNEPNRPDYFVVNFDRSESDVTTLNQADREQLSKDSRLTFVSDLPDLRKNMFAESSRTETWWLLLYAFLASLAVEAWMTRRMVRGGYAT